MQRFCKMSIYGPCYEICSEYSSSFRPNSATGKGTIPVPLPLVVATGRLSNPKRVIDFPKRCVLSNLEKRICERPVPSFPTIERCKNFYDSSPFLVCGFCNPAVPKLILDPAKAKEIGLVHSSARMEQAQRQGASHNVQDRFMSHKDMAGKGTLQYRMGAEFQDLWSNRSTG